MRIVFVGLNSSYIHTNLAIRYLAAAYENAGGESVTSEYSQKDRRGEILGSLYDLCGDVYAFSAYIWNIGDLCRIASELKLLRPDSAIVFGGPEVSFDAPEFLMSHPFVDCVITGEGEGVFEAAASGLKLCGIINGADYPAQSDFRTAGILYDRYPAQKGQMLYYESSRGCPYRCAYCMSAASGSVRIKDAETAARELIELGRLSDGGTVKLIDRTFNCDERRAEYIWRALIDSGVKCRWHFEIRTELLTDTAVGLLREGSDIFLLEAGIQSTCPETLRAIKRGGDPELGLKKLCELVGGKHPPVHADLIAGLPHETFERFKQSFDDAYPLCDELQLGFLKLLKGSELRRDAEKYGMKFSPEPPYELLESETISYDELRTMHRIADLTERYGPGRGFDRAVGYLLGHVTPFKLFEGLAKYTGDVRKLSQRQAYEKLFEYGLTIKGTDEDEFRENITADFTSREKGSIPFIIKKKAADNR